MYLKTHIQEVFVIKRIYSVFYFEFGRDYRFSGEEHDFWEILYVDRGELVVQAGGERMELKQGDLIFRKPNEFHAEWANRQVAPNVVVMSFECRSPAMQAFEGMVCRLNDKQRNLLAQAAHYGLTAFRISDTNNGNYRLVRRPNAPFGYEQLMKLHLELLLIDLYGNMFRSAERQSYTQRENEEREMMKRLMDYLEGRTSGNVSFPEVCKHFNISATRLIGMFRKHTGTSVMHYFKTLKIRSAKRFIREDQDNFTQIAERLGYSSIHSFSRQFRQVTGMSPSEYAKSVKAKMGIEQGSTLRG